MKAFHIHLVAAEGADLGTQFVDVCEQLNRTPRLHLELDGSFVWVGDGWQIDGMVYDRDERLQYVDLKGNCPKSVWETLTSVLVKDLATANVVQLPGGGLYDLQGFEKMTWA